MYTNPKQEDKVLLRSIRAVVFFGIPNQVMNISALIPMAEGQVNEEFLRSLGTDSADLQRQAQQWSKAFDCTESESLTQHSLEILSFYETNTSPTAIKVNGK